MSDLESLMRRVERERLARRQAETLLEQISGVLYEKNLELEKARDELERRVQERTAELEAVLVQAEAATRAKSQFLANMSHEIRTPLTAILGFAELLAERLEDPDSEQALQIIQRNGEHLLRLINDILDLSKIEAGKLQVERIKFSPYELLLDIKRVMQLRAEAKQLAWSLELDGPLPTEIASDPTRLRQILLNLVGNAIKFTETGSVLIRAGLEGEVENALFVVRVIDSGIGISKERQAQLFQPFQQADNSMSRRFGGTGLGLAISRRLADLLGGTLVLESRVGEGATFTLQLPVGSLAEITLDERTRHRAGDAVGIESEEASHVGEVLSGWRILIVEDGLDNQRLLEVILKRTGCQVTLCDQGEAGCQEALRAADAGRPYDVILMDMQMPVRDGYESVAWLRQRGYRWPIVALTANAMREDRQRCLDVGCDVFLSKPIKREKLLGALLGIGRAARETSDG